MFDKAIFADIITNQQLAKNLKGSGKGFSTPIQRAAIEDLARHGFVRSAVCIAIFGKLDSVLRTELLLNFDRDLHSCGFRSPCRYRSSWSQDPACQSPRAHKSFRHIWAQFSSPQHESFLPRCCCLHVRCWCSVDLQRSA
jgi:hypothetical protein